MLTRTKAVMQSPNMQLLPDGRVQLMYSLGRSGKKHRRWALRAVRKDSAIEGAKIQDHWIACTVKKNIDHRDYDMVNRRLQGLVTHALQTETRFNFGQRRPTGPKGYHCRPQMATTRR